MADPKPIIVKLLMENSQFKGSLEDAVKLANQFAEQTKKSENSLLKMASAFAIGQLAADAFKATLAEAKAILLEAVDAATKAEEAEQGYAQALATRGVLSRETFKAGKDLADQLSKQTLFTDEAILATEGLLVTLGKMGTDQLPQATAAVADLAARYHLDLETAARQVSLVLSGTTDRIRGTGIVIDSAIPPGERLAEVMRQIASEAGGAAQSQLNTFGGAVSLAAKAWDELLEQVGLFLVDSPAVKGLVLAVVEVLQSWGERLKELRGDHDTLLPLVQKFMENMTALARVLNVTAAIAQIIIGVFGGLAGTLGIIVRSIKDFYSAILTGGELIINFLETGLLSAIQKVSALASEALDFVGADEQAAKLKHFADAMKGEVGRAARETKVSMEDLNESFEGTDKTIDFTADAFKFAGSAVGDMHDREKLLIGVTNDLTEAFDRHLAKQNELAKAPQPFGATNAPGAPAPAPAIESTRTANLNAELAFIEARTRESQIALGEIKSEGNARDRELEREALEEKKAALKEANDHAFERMQELESIKEAIGDADFERRRRNLEEIKKANEAQIEIEAELILAQQQMKDEQSEQGREYRELALEENNEFLAALAEQFELHGTTFQDFMFSAMETVRGAGVEAFGQIENAAAAAAFAGIKGGEGVGAAWQALGDSLLKTVIGALVRIAAQFIITGIIGAAMTNSAAQAAVGLTGANTMASMALAPFPINLTAPLVALAFSGIAEGYAGKAASGGIGGIAGLLKGVAGMFGGGGAGEAGGAAGGALAGVGTLPAKAIGDEFVERTGAALIHQGERILTTEQNRDFTDFLRGRGPAVEGGGTTVNITIGGDFVGDQERIDALATAVFEAAELRNIRAGG